MFIKDVNSLKSVINYVLKRKRKRRGKRRKGKHLFSLFIGRRKHFLLYYQSFDSKQIYLNFGSNYNAGESLIKRNKFRLGLKSYKLKLIKIFCLKSLKFCTKRYLKSLYIDKLFRFNVSIFPDFWLTAKPKSVRMGKGKGDFKFKVYFLKRGSQIFNFRYLNNYFNFYIKKKLFLIKLSIFVNMLLKILKGKPSVKCLFYKLIF